ncbi:MAG: diguanylate cyclase domain-containing protein [Desulfosalsimonas sp.]
MPQIKFVRLVFAGIFVFWTAAVIAGYFTAVDYIRHSKLDLLKSSARSSIKKDIAYRHLFASLERIYVPRQGGIRANPFLQSPKKEAVTLDGQHLIQLNPAYLTRLFYEMDNKDTKGPGAALVSLKPVNPGNSPDKWQQKGLKFFEEGGKEVFELQKAADGMYLRLMQPLRVRQDCLQCHAEQGYRVGDIRGGISISMPASHYEKSIQKDKRVLTLGIAMIWLAGACAAGFAGRHMTRRVKERDKLADRLQYLSLHDPLTGLYNRFAFDHEMERLQKGRFDSISIIVCDVDGLKRVNDMHGHLQGDRLIISAARSISACLREGDLVARIGGDEFAVLITDTDEQECLNIMDRIRTRIDEFNSREAKFRLSLSMGCRHWSGPGPKNLQELFKKADDLMYRDKRRKKQTAG